MPKKRDKKAKAQVVPDNLDKLIELANEALANFKFDESIQLFERAHVLSPNDTNVMDALADVYMKINECAKAYELLIKSTTLQPNINPCKWCSLAQLQEGNDSLLSYGSAIEYLMNQLKDSINEDEKKVYIKHISISYCSIAELYLTDLCYEENAEKECETAILKSLEIEPENIQAIQTYCSFRLSQQRTVEAADMIERVYHQAKVMRDQYNNKSIIMEMTTTDTNNETDDGLPEPAFFVTMVKLLIECAVVKPTLIEYAMELLLDLMCHDDENIELWYLMGVAAMNLTPPDIEASLYHLEKAKDMLDIIKTNCTLTHEEFPFEDQYTLVLDHIQKVNQLQATTTTTATTATTQHDHTMMMTMNMSTQRQQYDTSSMDISHDPTTTHQHHMDDGNGNEGEEEEWSSCDEDEDI